MKKNINGMRYIIHCIIFICSAYMDVEISRDGYIHHDRYERGVPVVELEDGLLPKIGKTKKTGTKINFLPDDTIFEKTRFRAEEVKSRTFQLSSGKREIWSRSTLSEPFSRYTRIKRNLCKNRFRHRALLGEIDDPNMVLL